MAFRNSGGRAGCNCAILAVMTVALAGRADAGILVVLPNQAAWAVGNGTTGRPLVNGTGHTYQIVIAASELGGIPANSQVTGLTFRINPNGTGAASWPPAGVSAQFENYQIQLSQSLNPPGTLSTTFDNNLGPDVVTVRTGPLSIPPLSFPLGPGVPAPFGMKIGFTTPYTYPGGNLLITIRHTGSGVAVNPLCDSYSNTGNPPAPPYNTLIQAIGAAGSMAVTGMSAFATPVQLFDARLSVIGGTATIMADGAETGLLTAQASPGENPPSTDLAVRADLSLIGGPADVPLFDDGPAGGHGDAVAGDLVFSNMTTVAIGTPCAVHNLPVIANDAQGRTGSSVIAVQALDPFAVICLEPFIDENEVPCTVPDMVNGGCNSSPNVFTDIPCGARVCGTSWRIGSVRDTDWYRVQIAAPTNVTWRAIAEFPVVVGPVGVAATPGVPIVCGQPNVTVTPFAVGNPCQLVSVTTTTPLQPGTWYFFVAPQMTAQVACGRRYTAELIIENPAACPMPSPIVVCTGGDLNYDGVSNGLDMTRVVETILSGAYDCSLDLNGDDVLSGADVDLYAASLVAGNSFVNLRQHPCQDGQLTCIAFNNLAPAMPKDVIVQAADRDGNASGCPVQWSVRPILSYDAAGKPASFGGPTLSGALPSGQIGTVSLSNANEAVVVGCQDTTAQQCRISYVPPK